jgi:hypothetical protein
MVDSLINMGSRPDETSFFNLPNPSGHTRPYTQPLTEMSTRRRKIMFMMSELQPVSGADNLSAICVR